MSSNPRCELHIRYDKDGGLLNGECTCGDRFSSFSWEPNKSKEALEYMVKQWREHQHEIAENRSLAVSTPFLNSSANV